MKTLTFKIDNEIGDITLNVTNIIKEYKNPTKKVISEAFTKTDVKEIESIVRKQFKKEMMDDVEKKISEVIKKEIGGKENEDFIKDICQNIFIEFFKIIWVRRAFWSKSLGSKN